MYDNTTAIFINGKLANKRQFDALEASQIQTMSIGGIIYHKDLVRQYNLKQENVLKVTLKDNFSL